jgi:hypothetical protein
MGSKEKSVDKDYLRKIFIAVAVALVFYGIIRIVSEVIGYLQLSSAVYFYIWAIYQIILALIVIYIGVIIFKATVREASAKETSSFFLGIPLLCKRKTVSIPLILMVACAFIPVTLSNVNSGPSQNWPRQFSSGSIFSYIPSNPYVRLLVWVDIKAFVDKNNDHWLPHNPPIRAIRRWILITFDPDIETNHLFWCLAEVKAEEVEEILKISWVRKVTLVKVGGYVRPPQNPKFGFKGMGYAIQRAMKEGNKPLQIIVYTLNVDEIVRLIQYLGGETLRTGLYTNSVLANVPAMAIERIAGNPNVSEIYLNGPVIFG